MQVFQGAWRRLVVTGALSLSLSACATDPAFLEGLAMATTAIAAETAQMAEDARCVRHLSPNGETTTLCPLPPGVVARPPRLGPSSDGRYRPHDRAPRDGRETPWSSGR